MNRNTVVLLCFIIAKMLLQYALVSPEYDLHRDEYLHLDQGQHLAWGYLSVPPVTSWISALIGLLGESVFWVRFFPALFGACTMVLVWKGIEELKGNQFACILGATCVLFSALLRLNALYQPNSLDVLCWTGFYFVLIKYINSEDKKWLFAGAVVSATAILNKYNFAFLLIGLLPAILLSEHRKIFTKPVFYIALLVGFMLILPNVIWQYNNGFPVFHHMKQLADTQLINVNRWDFVKEQFLFFIGGIFVLLAGILALPFYHPFKRYRLFFWSIVFTLTTFILLKAKSYYAVGIYPIYLVFGSVFLADFLQTGWKRYLKPVAIGLPVLVFIPIFNIAFPNKSPEYIASHAGNYKGTGLLRWEDGQDHTLPQDFADMLGWKELAGKVDKVIDSLPAEKHTLVLCDNYGQAGAINYHSKNKDIRAVSFNADYINWFPLEQKIENVVRVKEYQNPEIELVETRPFFEKGIVADSVTNVLAREYKTLIFVFSRSKTDINKRLKIEIEEAKNRYKE